MSKLLKTAALLLLALFLILAVEGGKKSQAGETTTLLGAGATFPYPLYSKWFYIYHQITGVKVNYQAIGSGGGIRQLLNRRDKSPWRARKGRAPGSGLPSP